MYFATVVSFFLLFFQSIGNDKRKKCKDVNCIMYFRKSVYAYIHRAHYEQ